MVNNVKLFWPVAVTLHIYRGREQPAIKVWHVAPEVDLLVMLGSVAQVLYEYGVIDHLVEASYVVVEE